MSGFGDLTAKIENVFLDNLPHIKELITEKVGSAARGAVDNEQVCRFVATKIFNFLPVPIRKTVSEMEFADLFWKNRHAVFSRDRGEEIRTASGETVVLAQASEIEIIQTIYKRIEEQRNSLDEMFDDLRTLEKRINENT